MNSKRIAEEYHIDINELESFILRSDYKYSRIMFNGLDVEEDPEKVYKDFQEYKKAEKKKEKEKNTKTKLTPQDYDCVYHTDDPDFEQKFNQLLQKHIRNTEIDIDRMKDEDEKRKLSEKLKSFKYFLEYENWLTVLPTRVTFPITEKAKKKQFNERGGIFSNLVSLVGIFDSDPFYVGHSESEAADALAECYIRLFAIQEERVKNKGLRGVINRMTDKKNETEVGGK